MTAYGQTQSTLWGPVHLVEFKGSTDGLEISVHTLPKQVGNIKLLSRRPLSLWRKRYVHTICHDAARIMLKNRGQTLPWSAVGSQARLTISFF